MPSIHAIATTITFCALALAAQEARAGFTICNDLSESVWSAYSRIYRSRIITTECSFSQVVDGRCDYLSYKTRGWWRIEPQQCRRVDSADLPPFPDARSYVYIVTDSGDELTATTAGFYVTNDRFTWDSNVKIFDLHPNECLIESAVYDTCTHSGYWVNFREVLTGGFTDVTFRVVPDAIARKGGDAGPTALSMPPPEADLAE
ncbi:DUF1036 domain-containing protein [Nannocystis punicea]|uniref:DUF1036 domain-containing protein n=1 Tax=Nannocystis punicea TaxID=2995304 RepID=A0ABY7HCB7_9BACT|nr:DUF1036 domain-containing protein [Nannocystis poenicansa]WAS96639.1 DUF1036 domain-containing protein [Nannocystis poenicansa]